METVSVKPSYREPWKHRQFGLVLVDRFCEPHYGLGKPVRWQICIDPVNSCTGVIVERKHL